MEFSNFKGFFILFNCLIIGLGIKYCIGGGMWFIIVLFLIWLLIFFYFNNLIIFRFVECFLNYYEGYVFFFFVYGFKIYGWLYLVYLVLLEILMGFWFEE